MTTPTVAITLDTGCCRCRTKIQKILCCLQERWGFVFEKVVYEKDQVQVSGPFDAVDFCCKLRCKAGCFVTKIEILPPPEPPKKKKKKKKPPPPPPEPPKCRPLIAYPCHPYPCPCPSPCPTCPAPPRLCPAPPPPPCPALPPPPSPEPPQPPCPAPPSPCPARPQPCPPPLVCNKCPAWTPCQCRGYPWIVCCEEPDPSCAVM